MCYQSDLADIQPQIKAYITSRVFNKSDINDLAQEVNKILIEKESDFEESGNFFAWAMTITRYQIMGYMTAKKRRKGLLSLDEHPVCEKVCLGKEEEAWLSDIPFADMVEEEISLLKEHLISNFTPFQRTIFKLLCQGYSNGEIAEKVNKSYNAVQVARHRLIKQAKEHLKSLNRKNRYDYRSKGQY